MNHFDDVLANSNEANDDDNNQQYSWCNEQIISNEKIGADQIEDMAFSFVEIYCQINQQSKTGNLFEIKF